MAELKIPESIASSAVATASMRAHEGTRADALFDDPLARLLVSARQEVPAEQRGHLADGVNETSSLTQVMGEYVTVRTHFFDTYLKATVQAGARQIVLLGSGLDARAYRMQWPAGTRIFEIDTPDVHAFKDELVARSGLSATAERVPIDSDATGNWRELIAAAGFDDFRPTAWLLEGLLFYLDRATSDTIAADIAASPAPAAWLAGDYLTATPEQRAQLAAHHRENGEETQDSGEGSIVDGLVPHTAPGPGVAPSQWLSSAQWEVSESEFAEHGGLIDRHVPAHWDPARGGDSMWMFHARRI
ncbi:SAM-dependent methyltransferase [Streptomyces sp. NPDC093065]|uniref:SAM-dependent methyltransferase n=1 Tax=Streptomyces sp. NPDC093065 TaxID=3366021 RepID=UPI00380E9C78